MLLAVLQSNTTQSRSGEEEGKRLMENAVASNEMDEQRGRMEARSGEVRSIYRRVTSEFILGGGETAKEIPWPRTLFILVSLAHSFPKRCAFVRSFAREFLCAGVRMPSAHVGHPFQPRPDGEHWEEGEATTRFEECKDRCWWYVACGLCLWCERRSERASGYV